MPHKRFDSVQASKFGIEQSQPLVVVPVESSSPIQQPLLSVKSTGVIVTSLKPSEDGQARIVRLFNVSGRPERATLVWAKPAPETVWLSNFAEEEISEVTGSIKTAAYEIVTLRIPIPKK
jgi:alpha-mannosidase